MVRRTDTCMSIIICVVIVVKIITQSRIGIIARF